MKIKNWNEFQHYKHRDPPWIRLYRRLLNDREWDALDGDSAKALIGLWLIAAERGGELPSIADIAFRLRMTEKNTNQVISRLKHWIESVPQVASAPLAGCAQDATTETDNTETETDNSEADGAHKRASRLADDWWPSSEDLTYAQGKGLSGAEISVEAEKFRNHWTSKGGRDAAKLNWHRTWENWILTAIERKGKPNGHARPQRQTLVERGQELAEQAREHERERGIGRPDDPFGSH